ncbi:MAG: hypothetical protein GY792_30825 [Gammaproteobacteria bacterium]|nr:hypothetical protein [Gammaproteobacteria bacterium]
MSIFISYDRQDETVAHFLSQILTLKGLSVLIDRKISAGAKNPGSKESAKNPKNPQRIRKESGVTQRIRGQV